ncbi:MAG: dtpB [Burkholderiales bacterium]|jgi:POT family proton-dependent oligopeptide transporter|nr:dtpB [Burkholderiales bacterium]
MKFFKNNYMLILGEFFDRLNFYGIQSILILYMINIKLSSEHNSIALYGAYSSMGFILPIFGGYLVDKFSLSRYNVILAGIFSIYCGSLLLLLYPSEMFLFGLCFILIGISLFKANNAVLFGSLFNDRPEKRDIAFTYYYMAMSLGAVAGPLIYGNVNIIYGWKYGFSTSLVGFTMCFSLYFLRAKYFRNIQTHANNASKLTLYKIGILVIGLFFLVYSSLICHLCLIGLILLSAMAVIYIIFKVAKNLKSEERRKLYLLIISMCYGVFFYASSLQVSSSLILYIARSVNTTIFGYSIPPEYFMSISSIFIVLLTPLATLLWQKNKITSGKTLVSRVNIGVYAASFGFLLIAFSALFSKSIFHGQLVLIVMALLALGFGELAIGPVITSAVTYLAPERKQGVFMGIWYLSIGYSAYFSSLIADVISSHYHIIRLGNVYFQNFLLFAGVGLLIAASMTLMKHCLSSLYLN